MFTSLQDLIENGFKTQASNAKATEEFLAQIALEQSYQSCLMELQAEKE